MARRHLGVLLVVLIALIVPSVPGVQAQAVPRTLKFAIGIDIDTLDPLGQTTTTVQNMIDYVFETLVGLDYKQNKILPQLATSWQEASNGLSITFKLRGDAKFQDGTPVNAEAVKFTFDRLLDPKTTVPQRFYVDGIKEVQAVDPLTVRFVLGKPTPLLLRNLTSTVTSIISPAAYRKIGAANFTRDITNAGSGPYVFKEWVRGTHLLVVRNPSYWGKKPVFDEVQFRVVPDAGVRETMLLSGDVHVAVLPPAPDARRIRTNPALTLVEAPTDRTVFIVLNNQQGHLKDARVRQALNYAINKRAILASVLFNLGTVVDSPCPSMLFGYTPMQQGGWPYNPAKAKQLLAEAGVPKGFEVSFITPTGRYIQDFQFAQAIASQLRNIGVTANVSTMEWPSYVAAITRPVASSKVEMAVLGWATSVLDCDGTLYGQFHSSQAPPGGLAPAFYKNDRVDQLLAEARTVANQDKRKALYKEAQTLIWNDAPWIFLWTQKWYIATVKSLHDVGISPIEKWDAIYATWK